MFRKSAVWVGAAIAAVVLVVVVALLWVFGVGMFQRSTAEFRGQTSAIERTKANAQFRLQAYEQFFSDCSAIQALEDQARIYADDPTDEGKTNLQAVHARRAQLVREYNARATADFTEGEFRDSDLPYLIDINGENTQCAA